MYIPYAVESFKTYKKLFGRICGRWLDRLHLKISTHKKIITFADLSSLSQQQLKFTFRLLKVRLEQAWQVA